MLVQVHPGDAFYLLSLIKYASTLIVGVTSGVWIFSRKTLSSWRRVFCSLLHCRLPEPSPSHLYQPADLIYIKSHTDVSSSQVYGSTVRHHGGYGVMMPEKL
uniref:Frizzled/Smoothened transmembrane domain-containing protein n=1 Tax=Plectus sambesii TaxID=2011161 RepID=A0A914V4L0_9BILA